MTLLLIWPGDKQSCGLKSRPPGLIKKSDQKQAHPIHRQMKDKKSEKETTINRDQLLHIGRIICFFWLWFVCAEYIQIYLQQQASFGTQIEFGQLRKKKNQTLPQFLHGLAVAGPPDCPNIQLPHCFPQMSFSTWLELIPLSTPQAKSAFSTKTYKHKNKKESPAIRSARETSSNLQPSKQNPSCPSTNPPPKKKIHHKEKKPLDHSSMAAPANHKPPCKALINPSGGWANSWAIITFHSSRFKWIITL